MVDSLDGNSDARSGGSLLEWLALERIPRCGPLTIARLIDAFGSPQTVMAADAAEIRRRAGLREKLARTVAEFTPPKEEILKDLDALDRLRAEVITRWDPAYPENLKQIYDPPALLFVRGAIVPEDSRAVAIVGTRNPGRYGLEITESIATDLARQGVTLVSGLARGIDTACHKAALKAGGRTIGVLGCGIDVVYPRENKALVEEMLDAGAVITEFRPGIPPLPTNFFRRNRIVSGLSKGVLVVEAGRNSGSLITAAHAVDQNRDVFAVPGNVFNLRSRGPHELIKQGAGLVESAEDIMQALFETAKVVQQPSLFHPPERNAELPESAQIVIEALDLDPVHIDILCESLGMEPGKLVGILLELELAGLVRQHPGKMFARITA